MKYSIWDIISKDNLLKYFKPYFYVEGKFTFQEEQEAMVGNLLKTIGLGYISNKSKNLYVWGVQDYGMPKLHQFDQREMRVILSRHDIQRSFLVDGVYDKRYYISDKIKTLDAPIAKPDNFDTYRIEDLVNSLQDSLNFGIARV
jgi:hypothetical protein